jgi:hypothetical protein
MSSIATRLLAVLTLAASAAGCAADFDDSSASESVASNPQELSAARRYVFRSVSSWSGGYQGSVTLTNLSSAPISNWQFSFTEVGVTGAWGADVTLSGNTVTARAPSYAPALAAGASVTVTFNANGSAQPSNCQDNSGTICSIENASAPAPETTITGYTQYYMGRVYTFSSSVAGSTFECRCDNCGSVGTYAVCTSGGTNANCGSPCGPGRFYVRAVSPAGTADGTPATAP